MESFNHTRNRVKKLTIRLGVALFIVFFCIDSSAQDSLKLPLTDKPPQVDGVLSEGEWANAASVELTSQIEPQAGAPGTEKTIAYLMYDRENLYVAFRAFDSNPSAIRAPVSKRDAISSDDFVAIWLDTFDDRRRAYAFRFNPLGIQEDGIFSEGDRSLSWDGIYESKGTVDAEGYTVEAKIPFKTLRFSINENKSWGLHLFRSIARKQEDVSWMPISRDNSNIFSQMGSLTGLDEVFAGRTLELIPTVTLSNAATREEDSTVPDGAKMNTVNRLDVGLTAIYQITPNLTLSATVNPDFSQIEADAPQVTVNQRFPLFFAEKRPFFLEGSEIFRPFYSSAPRIIDTRQIVDPDWGIKLTGKVGKNGLGFLAASDRAPGLRVPATNINYRKDALFTIGRFTRDIFKGSTVGMSLTDRRFGNSSNTVGTFDGRIRIDDRQSFSYQLSYSKTSEPDGTKRSGGGAYFAYNYNDKNWDVIVTDSHYARNFRAQTGFFRRTGYDRIYTVVGRSFRPKEKSWWVRVRPFVVALAFWDERRNLDESFFDPGIDLTFAKGITVYTYFSARTDHFGGRGLPSRSFNLRWSFAPFQKITARGGFEIGTDANFDPKRVEVGKLSDYDLTVTLKPFAKLNSEIRWIKSSLKGRIDGGTLFDQSIYRNRTTYQFDRFNAVRSILDYDTFSRRLGVSLLYSYTPRPNTAVFVGYGDALLNGIDPLNGNQRSGLIRESRTVFAKFSYNYRF